MKNPAACATFMPMKKAIAVIFSLLLAQAALADEVKAMLGIHSSKYLFSSEITSLNRQQKSGLDIGLGYALAINPKMMLEAQVVFNKKGAKTELPYAPGKTASGTYSNRAISLPLFFRYRFTEGASPYAALGPEFSFILAHKLTIPEYDESFDIIDSTNKFIVAFNVALGYAFPLDQWGLFAEIRYNRGLSDLLKGPGPSVKCESVSFMLGGIYRP